MKSVSIKKEGRIPIINRKTTGMLNRAISLRLRSLYVLIDMILILPKKIRLKAQSIYTAPSTILVAAKIVAQKLKRSSPRKI
jgi:hypothetical protein